MLDHKSLRDLSRTVEASIEEDRGDIEEIISRELGDDKSGNLARYATLMLESGKEKSAQQTALKEYYRLFGMDERSEQRFRKEVWPLIEGDATAEPRAKVLQAIQAKDEDAREEKFDFALREVMPNYTTENQASWPIREQVDSMILKSNASREAYSQVKQEVDEFLLPVLERLGDGGQETNYVARQGLRLADEVIKWGFENVESNDSNNFNDIVRAKREEFAGRIRRSEELMALMSNTTRDTFEIKSKLMGLAFRRDYEPKFVEYLKVDVFPKIERNDEALGSWQRGSQYMRGEAKYREYDLNCLTTKISPREISRLLLERRELPTSDTERLEQNRIDALAVEHVVIPDHTFIHHEHPKTHDLLQAMVNYYDMRETKQAEEAEQNLRNVAKDCPSGMYGRLDNYIYDLNKYEKNIKGEVWDDDIARGRQYNDRAIDVLRRLVQNTLPDETEIPPVDNAIWYKLMTEANVRVNPETGERQADWKGTGELVKYVNDWLVARQGEYGLDSAKINAVAFAERAATYALRGVSEKERQELPYDETFKEFVKLQELTGRYDNFSLAEFEKFWEWFQNVKMDDAEGLSQHYMRLATRELEQAGKLEKMYRKEKIKDAGMILQSNNLLHEIVMLLDPRQENTVRRRMDNIIAEIEMS